MSENNGNEGPSTPAKHHPIKTGTWSDAEKVSLNIPLSHSVCPGEFRNYGSVNALTQLAFLVSILNSVGARPKWSEVSVPAGRTLQACQKMFGVLLNEAAQVEMTGGSGAKPTTPHNRKNTKNKTNANPGAAYHPNSKVDSKNNNSTREIPTNANAKGRKGGRKGNNKRAAPGGTTPSTKSKRGKKAPISETKVDDAGSDEGPATKTIKPEPVDADAIISENGGADSDAMTVVREEGAAAASRPSFPTADDVVV